MRMGRVLAGLGAIFLTLVCLISLAEHARPLRGARWLVQILPFGIATDAQWLCALLALSIAVGAFAWRGGRGQPTTFLLIAPASDGQGAGALVQVRSGSQLACAGFATRALARQFVLRAGLSAQHRIVALGDLGTAVPLPYPHASSVARFDSASVLQCYLDNPGGWTMEGKMVPLETVQS